MGVGQGGREGEIAMYFPTGSFSNQMFNFGAACFLSCFVFD